MLEVVGVVSMVSLDSSAGRSLFPLLVVLLVLSWRPRVVVLVEGGEEGVAGGSIWFTMSPGGADVSPSGGNEF